MANVNRRNGFGCPRRPFHLVDNRYEWRGPSLLEGQITRNTGKVRHEWHVITGEYPPQPGGVADYTRLIARGLGEAGESVHVWAGPHEQRADEENGVTLHRLPNNFGLKGLAALRSSLAKFPAPRRILVQYVPHAFGFKGLNLLFCFWLLGRREDSIWIMFHEVCFPYDRRQPIRHKVLAVGTRLMAMIVSRAATGIFVSAPAWKGLLRSLTRKSEKAVWLPVPSNVPVIPDEASRCKLRSEFKEKFIVGHFGTYGAGIAPPLEKFIPALLSELEEVGVLLLGRGSDHFRHKIVERFPLVSERLKAYGYLDPVSLSSYLSACDLLVQPFPDGVTTRRTSLMTGLAHGLPIITTIGHLTESLWENSRAVLLVESEDPERLIAQIKFLIDNKGERMRLALAARQLYDDRFSLERVLEALRREICSCESH